MKHLAAYMLLVLGGNASPAEKDIKDLLKAAGVQEDKESLACLMEKMTSKSVVDMTKEGMTKFASMPAGGSGGAAAAGAPAAGAAKAEAKKEESEEEADVDMGGLFGDDY